MNKKSVFISIGLGLILCCKSSFANWNSVPEGDFHQLHLLLWGSSRDETNVPSLSLPTQLSEDEKTKSSNSSIRVTPPLSFEQLDGLSSLYFHFKANSEHFLELGLFSPMPPLDGVPTLRSSEIEAKGAVPTRPIFLTETTSQIELTDRLKKIESTGTGESTEFFIQAMRLVTILNQMSFNWDEIVKRYVTEHLKLNATNSRIEALLDEYEKEVLESRRELQQAQSSTPRFPVPPTAVAFEEKTKINPLKLTLKPMDSDSFSKLPISIPPQGISGVRKDSKTKVLPGSSLSPEDTTSLDDVYSSLEVGSIPQGKKDLLSQLASIEYPKQSYFRAISYLKHSYLQNIRNSDDAFQNLSWHLTQELRRFWDQEAGLGGSLDTIDPISGLKWSEVIFLLRETLITTEDEKLFNLNLSTLLMRSAPERYEEVIRIWVVQFYYQISSPIKPLRRSEPLCLIL